MLLISLDLLFPREEVCVHWLCLGGFWKSLRWFIRRGLELTQHVWRPRGMIFINFPIQIGHGLRYPGRRSLSICDMTLHSENLQVVCYEAADGIRQMQCENVSCWYSSSAWYMMGSAWKAGSAFLGKGFSGIFSELSTNPANTKTSYKVCKTFPKVSWIFHNIINVWKSMTSEMFSMWFLWYFQNTVMKFWYYFNSIC